MAFNPPLSAVLPPLILGTATFTHQYNNAPEKLSTTTIVHSALLSGIRGFDTSPYYGPAESLLGCALHNAPIPRDQYILQTKCGRIDADTFDYTPARIRESVARSLELLKTDYLDVVFCHDVEFVTPDETVTAVRTLRGLRDEGKIRYVGISGYPVPVLADLAERIKSETGESLDAVMSYAHYTLQNTALVTCGLKRFVDAGVGCVMNGSPLGMGLLRGKGVPVGDLGDFHPAPKELRDRCAEAARVVGASGKKLETVALKFALEEWMKDGALAGTRVNPLVSTNGGCRAVDFEGRIGVTVAGVSFIDELKELLTVWRDAVVAPEGKSEDMYKKVMAVLGKEWKDYSWPSPGIDYVRKCRRETP
jgi:D-arabinose 1-dehydrogenase